MEKVGIVTDSNSGITQQQGEALGVYVLPMPFYIDEELYYEDITLTQEQFYSRLKEEAQISTSQPSPTEVTAMWDKVLTQCDTLVHIPMSSGLSGSCQTASMLAQDYDGRVQVVDNQRISVTQKQSIMDAMALAASGHSAEQIRQILERDKMESSIYITVDTLRYLKKGGRITPAAAAVGTVLNLKPVLQIQGEKLDAFSKARGMKMAKKMMLDAMQKDLEVRFAGKPMRLAIAYTGFGPEIEAWKQEVQERFPSYELVADPLSLSVSCHIGEGALGIACAMAEEG